MMHTCKKSKRNREAQGDRTLAPCGTRTLIWRLNHSARAPNDERGHKIIHTHYIQQKTAARCSLSCFSRVAAPPRSCRQNTSAPLAHTQAQLMRSRVEMRSIGSRRVRKTATTLRALKGAVHRSSAVSPSLYFSRCPSQVHEFMKRIAASALDARGQ